MTESLFDVRRQMVEKFDPDGSRRAKIDCDHGGLPAMPESCDHCLTVLERDALAEGLRVSYPATPVDALLSDLAVTATLDAVDADYVLDRIKEFGIEVGKLDAEGKPVDA